MGWGVLHKISSKTPYKQKGNLFMIKFICDQCGYVYNPEDGDLDTQTLPGTLFHDLPDSWVCPVCQAPKEEFSAI